MRVVQINAAFRYGSTGRTVMEMHEYLGVCGVESYVFYPSDSSDTSENDNVFSIGKKIDHSMHAFLSRLFGRQAYYSYRPTKCLIGRLRKVRPDIVILRNLHSNYINLRLLCKYLADNDIATIVVLHDCWFYTGHCFHYTEVCCYKWKNECHHCPLIHFNNVSWFFDTSRTVFKDKRKWIGRIKRLAIVGVSDWITDEAKQSPIFENAKIVKRIYNWIDSTVFFPKESTDLKQKLGIRDDAFLALGVAMTWDYHKGLDVFIQIAQAKPDIIIVLIGQMPNLNLPSNIITVPRTTSAEELACYYSLSDVLLNFSLQESFGKVSAEALACGTPIIVNKSTANTELPGDCGYVVDNNDLSQILEAIESIRLRGKDFFSKRCVERSRSLFDKNKNLEEYERLFQELIHPKE